MYPSLIFSFGSFSVSICSVIGASPSILAPVFAYSVHLSMLLQLYSVQAAFGNGGATQVRSFAAPADRPPVSGDGKFLILLFFGILLVENLLWSWIYYSYVYVLEQ
jgi:hypothetical protein